MQYKRLGNIVAVVLASAIGWTLNISFRPVQAEPSDNNASVADTPQRSNLSESTDFSPASTSASTTVAKVGEPATASSNSEPAIAKVFSHELEARPAATLYVRDIPVLTFVTRADTESDTAEVEAATVKQSSNLAEEGRKLATASDDTTSPLAKANQLAAKLNRLNSAGDVEAQKISVKWQDDEYLVQMEEDTLVTLTKDIILPDTTGARTEDALQATNRLRRLLGDEAVEPLSEVSDLPAPPEPEPVVALAPASEFYQQGEASWYGPGFHGNLTANGEIFNQNALTAAHRYLAFGTWVRVTNLNNGYAVNVRINDRGPYSGGRVIDLSAAAADYIGLTGSGVAPVRIDILY